MLPQAARDHEAEQDDLLAKVLRSVTGAWRLMRGRNWERAWQSDVGPRVVDAINTGQEAAAAQSETYMAAVLAELSLDGPVDTSLNLSQLVGVTGDGREVASGAYGAVITAAKAQYSPRLVDMAPARAADLALAEAEAWVEEYAATLIADAARAAETVALAQRPWVDGYVRMIEPGACSRCVILAGRFYLFNEGFDRHERCRCKHIPAMENDAESILTNPNLYFDSLPTDAEVRERYPNMTREQRNKAGIYSQEDVFTTAGAEAVRLGADISQVVNARRGMNTAQQNPRGWIPKGRMQAVKMFGRDVFVTTEGVTKRGVYGKVRGKKPVRLMPESILSIASDREDAIRLLKVYGYLT